MKTPLISVIIPNYNHADFLHQRIESVLNQTFQDFEIILLDDCSTDNSCEILEEYSKHPKVSHFIKNTINSGSPFKQWSKGFELTKGRYIWIAESDDWCEPNFLETMIAGFNGDTTIVLAYSQSHFIHNGMTVWTTRHRKPHEIMKGQDFVKKYMITKNSVCNASSAVFLKDTLQKITPYFMRFSYCGDWLFWTEIALQGKIFTTNKALNHFRNHSGDVSSKANASDVSYREELEVLKLFKKREFIDGFEYIKGVRSKYFRFRMDNGILQTTYVSLIKRQFENAGLGKFTWLIIQIQWHVYSLKLLFFKLIKSFLSHGFVMNS